MIDGEKYKIAKHLVDMMFKRTTEKNKLFERWLAENDTAQDTVHRLSNYKTLLESKQQHSVGVTSAEDSARLLMNKISNKNRISTNKRVLIGVSATITALVILSFLITNDIYIKSYIPKENTIVNNAMDVVVPSLVLSSGEVLDLSLNDIEQVKSNNNIIISKKGESSIAISDTSETIQELNIVIPSSTMYNLELPDGTIVYLNANSSLSFPSKFPDDKREVTFDGEAYFIVAKNKKKPFIVKSKHVHVEVFGTSFNINTKNKEAIRTVLVEGSLGVQLNNKIAITMLNPNEHFTYDSKLKKQTTGEIDVKNYICWINKEFNYTNIDLIQLLENISTWHNINFEYSHIDSSYLKNLKIDICFDMNSDKVDLLMAIEQNTNLLFVREAENLFRVNVVGDVLNIN